MNKPLDVSANFDHNQQILACQGNWVLANILILQQQLNNIIWPKSGTIVINGSKINRLDSSGAWLIIKLQQQLTRKNLTCCITNLSPEAEILLNLIMRNQMSTTEQNNQQLNTHGSRKLWRKISAFGYRQLCKFNDYLTFLGQVTIDIVNIIKKQQHIRISGIVQQMNKSGLQALTIIALLSFMIGVVIAYQMGFQLRNYGANVFIVDLLGLSILREFGPLLAAIMVAGRTGSSFAAEIGMMKLNQEIDTLNAMGITPQSFLFLPRILALLLTLPLLTMWANIFGVLGGMLMAKNILEVNMLDFLVRFQQAIPLSALCIGLGKAPIFALIIASIGCFAGNKVENSAAMLGQNTTQAVVLAIFFIIVSDAIFSIVFSKVGI